MLKTIFIAAVLAPMAFLPVYANGTSETLSEYQDGSSFDPKLESLENCTPTDISMQDNALTSARVEEVAAYMEAYSLPYESSPEIVSVPVNSALLNGLTVKVEFTYGDDNVTDTMYVLESKHITYLLALSGMIMFTSLPTHAQST